MDLISIQPGQPGLLNHSQSDNNYLAKPRARSCSYFGARLVKKSWLEQSPGAQAVMYALGRPREGQLVTSSLIT
jgi:hypothetical protein